MLAGTGCHTPQTFPRGKALLTPSPLPSIIEDLSQRSLMLFMVHKPWEQLITFSFMFPEHFIFLLICFALDSILPDINHAAPVFLKKITALLGYNSHTIKFTLLKYAIQWLLEDSQSHTTITIILIPEHFHHPRKKPISSHFLSPLSSALTTTNLLFISMDLPILEFYMCGIMQYVTFCDWLLSLNIISFGFMHAIASISTSFL